MRVRIEVPSLEWVNWNEIRETLPGGPAVIEVTVEDVTTPQGREHTEAVAAK